MLVKNAKRITFERRFFLFNNFTTVKALPPLKINKVVEKRLHRNQATTFWTLHTTSFPFILNSFLVK
jgi:hypothetical protein